MRREETMCERESSRVTEAVVKAAFAEPCPSPNEVSSGSRRRRLWELPPETHCPIVGVCLPATTLRKLVGKALGSTCGADDYEFHVAAVAECGQRRPISELLQRELDRRYALAIRRLARHKSTGALAACWEEARAGFAVADALWATLTHPRCDEALRQKVCRDVHMFQHQAGAGARADLRRMTALEERNAALTGELCHARERHKKELQQRDAGVAGLQAQLVQARGRLVARDAEVEQLQLELRTLQERIPDLPSRVELDERLQQQADHVLQLERERSHWQRLAHQIEERARQLALEVEVWRARSQSAQHEAEPPACLRDKNVLCVGGRPASVPVYRELIECSGARFLHHDGGEENSSAQLEVSLAAADLVICQTGCVSHGAYWRVKDYCKRSGKQCVFVEKPSASSLARCLRSLGWEAERQAGDQAS